MPVSPDYRPDPRFPNLGLEFADPVAPAEFPQTLLRVRNDRAAATVGLDTLTEEEWIAHFGRFAVNTVLIFITGMLVAALALLADLIVRSRSEV